MKKNNLFKAVGIVILAYVLLSWIVPIIYSIGGFKGEVSNQIGIVSLLNAVLETFSGFGAIVLYVLMVGGFYGVLKVVGAYDKMIDYLSYKASGREKAVLITIMVLMALVSSVSGLDLGLLIVFPLLIDLVIKMGYDKMVALSATLGATIIGMYGATFAGTLYGANNTILELDKFSQIIPKVILFVVGLMALVAFVLMNTTNKKLIKDSKITESVKASKPADKKDKNSKQQNSKKLKKNIKKDKKDKVANENTGAIPALIITFVLNLVVLLGTVNWAGIFKTNWFESAHKSWTGVTISKFAILDKLFGGVDAFGTWLTPTRFQTYSLLLLIAMFIIVLVYKTKFAEAFDGFVDGVKSFVVPAILTILACSVFVLVYYNPFMNTVTSLLLEVTKEFNVLLFGLYTIVNSLLYVDYYYFAYSLLANMSQTYDDPAILSIVSVMFTNLYSLVMLIAPTSVLLLVSLSISDVKYTDWIKYIWKLALALFVISFVVFIVMFMM